MKKLQNVIYVTLPNCYLALSGGNINLLVDHQSIAKVPLNNLEGICTFGHQGISPALMEECLERKISISFFNQNGRFRARITGTIDGNVTLRKTQYRWSDDEELSKNIARNFIIGKVYNTIHMLKQVRKSHALRIELDTLNETIEHLSGTIDELKRVDNLESLRGLEGEAASRYFQIWDHLILQQKESFFFHGRSRWNVNTKLDKFLKV
ncbi:CRISPR-associated endonuclease Cas1 [Alkalihalobacillus clausii]|uniref:CRISPR-associated endonuclease Cas1 n=1 Tax=Shouchella clausii TaxID=79880 RepID=UPI00203CDA5D|nr:CRISPR-associated endonuclease Cas1 [Shouchella clausii]